MFQEGQPPIEPGVFGLTNNGNECFINGTLQLLLAQQHLVEYLRGCQESNVPNYPQEFWEFFEAVWDQGAAGHYAFELKIFLNRSRLSYLCNGQQQDAEEFLSGFIQLLHELNPADLLSSPEDGASQSKLEWAIFLQYKSIVSSLFPAQLETRTRCTRCRYLKRTYEHFKILTLHFPEGQVDGKLTFSSLLDERLRTTDEHRECERCCRVELATSKHRFRKCPLILIVHFLRFRYSQGEIVKINTELEIPLTVGVPIKANDPTVKQHYDLNAVLSHIGDSGHEGHYVAQTKNHISRRWYLFDDDYVQRIKEPDTSMAYIAMFTKCSQTSQQE